MKYVGSGKKVLTEEFGMEMGRGRIIIFFFLDKLALRCYGEGQFEL